MNSIQSFLKKGTCAVTVCCTIREELVENGFTELLLSEPWQLKAGGAYFVSLFDSSLVAFRVGKKAAQQKPFFRIVSAHTDQPGLKLKPSPEILQGGLGKLNISIYGGPIYSSWLDRPLSLAGKVILAGATAYDRRTLIVDLQRPLFTVPSLAIHMNREVNSGIALNPQIDLQPLAGLTDDAQFVRTLLVRELNEKADQYGAGEVASDQILDFDLFAYNADEPQLLGLNEELISSPRIDDLIMVKAGLDAMIAQIPEEGVTVLAALDNEEIGSRTPQGGGSSIMSLILEKIAACLGKDRLAFLDLLTSSFMLSGDVAHAVHPNHPEAHDKNVCPVLGGGIVIKKDAGQRYMTNSADTALVRRLCEENAIPVQEFISRADKTSGSTLGPVMCAFLPCHIVDIGTPMFSMHSARETAAMADFTYTAQTFAAFFKE